MCSCALSRVLSLSLHRRPGGAWACWDRKLRTGGVGAAAGWDVSAGVAVGEAVVLAVSGAVGMLVSVVFVVGVLLVASVVVLVSAVAYVFSSCVVSASMCGPEGVVEDAAVGVAVVGGVRVLLCAVMVVVVFVVMVVVSASGNCERVDVALAAAVEVARRREVLGCGVGCEQGVREGLRGTNKKEGGETCDEKEGHAT
eukprot:5637820-Pleurochrysis_carterae.AAC.1